MVNQEKENLIDYNSKTKHKIIIIFLICYQVFQHMCYSNCYCLRNVITFKKLLFFFLPNAYLCFTRSYPLASFSLLSYALSINL